MFDKLLSGTVEAFQMNIDRMWNSYPVQFISNKIFGDKPEADAEKTDAEKTDAEKTDSEPFDDSSAIPDTESSYVSLLDTIIGAIHGKTYSWYRWLFFGIGILLTYIVVSCVGNDMKMLPWQLRLFAGIYLLLTGLYSDFMNINIIYYVLIGYGVILLRRQFDKAHMTNPTFSIIPFDWDAIFIPLRTTKNNWMDYMAGFFGLTYLKQGASGVHYNKLVLKTDDYINEQKKIFADYETLKGTFGLGALDTAFTDHMIDMNLPGFLPAPVSTVAATLEAAADTVRAATPLISKVPTNTVANTAANTDITYTNNPMIKPKQN